MLANWSLNCLHFVKKDYRESPRDTILQNSTNFDEHTADEFEQGRAGLAGVPN